MRITTLILALLFSLFSFSQNQDRVGPIDSGTSEPMYEVPSIASKMGELIPYVDEIKEIQDGKATPGDIIPGKGSSGEDLLAESPGKL